MFLLRVLLYYMARFIARTPACSGPRFSQGVLILSHSVHCVDYGVLPATCQTLGRHGVTKAARAPALQDLLATWVDGCFEKMEQPSGQVPQKQSPRQGFGAAVVLRINTQKDPERSSS